MLSLTPRIHHALELSARLHREQNRKDILMTPYFTHLVGVMILIAEGKGDEDTLIAGLMHDSIEDVAGYTYKKLVEDCGVEVANIVNSVTEVRDVSIVEDRSLSWLTMKANYLESLRSGSDKSVLVSCADKTHNLMTLMSNYEKEGEEFLKRFSSMRNTLWFNDEVEKIVLERLDNKNPLVKRFVSTLKDAHIMFGEYEK